MSLSVRNYIKIGIRSYARWTHRRPTRVLINEECDKNNGNAIEQIDESSIDLNQTQLESQKNVDTNKHWPQHVVKQTQKKEVDMLETVIDPQGNFVYTKMKNNDPRIGFA